jgi:hypothetical protein
VLKLDGGKETGGDGGGGGAVVVELGAAVEVVAVEPGPMRSVTGGRPGAVVGVVDVLLGEGGSAAAGVTVTSTATVASSAAKSVRARFRPSTENRLARIGLPIGRNVTEG